MRRLWFLLAFVVLAGCSHGPTASKPTYTPVPDAVLYARIAKINGVESSDLNWVNRFGQSNSYGGDIHVRAGVDAAHVLDEALAILRMGRPGAFYTSVEVFQPGASAISPTDFGLWSQADYTQRYGPQPGTGLPPQTPLEPRH